MDLFNQGLLRHFWLAYQPSTLNDAGCICCIVVTHLSILITENFYIPAVNIGFAVFRILIKGRQNFKFNKPLN